MRPETTGGAFKKGRDGGRWGRGASYALTRKSPVDPPPALTRPSPPPAPSVSTAPFLRPQNAGERILTSQRVFTVASDLTCSKAKGRSSNARAYSLRLLRLILRSKKRTCELQGRALRSRWASDFEGVTRAKTTPISYYRERFLGNCLLVSLKRSKGVGVNHSWEYCQYCWGIS